MKTVIEDLSRNEEMDTNDTAAIEGGIASPSLLHGAPMKLIAPPQPVTQPSVAEAPSVPVSSISFNFTSIEYEYSVGS